jgi:hypothetical protein
MPTIRIDKDVWKALQELATPFVDTPNDVLRRVFQLDKVAASAPTQVSEREGKVSMIGATPQSAYRLPIVQSLREMHDKGLAADVLKAIYKKLESKLKPADLEPMENTGEPRWRLQARFERKNMALDGLLKPDSPRGLWELTEKGKKYVDQLGS